MNPFLSIQNQIQQQQVWIDKNTIGSHSKQENKYTTEPKYLVLYHNLTYIRTEQSHANKWLDPRAIKLSYLTFRSKLKDVVVLVSTDGAGYVLQDSV